MRAVVRRGSKGTERGKNRRLASGLETDSELSAGEGKSFPRSHPGFFYMHPEGTGRQAAIRNLKATGDRASDLMLRLIPDAG